MRLPITGALHRNHRRARGSLFVASILFATAISTCWSQSIPPEAQANCGQVVTIATHANTTTQYALASPERVSAQVAPVALLLLPGGGGHLDLDGKGCPRAMQGNFLVRSLAQFHAEGFITALADAPSNHTGDEGLAGFRTTAEHAADLGKVIADLRARTQASVWVVGTSRGTISAANAAVRLKGSAAPDGLILTSTVTVGSRGKRPWVSQTVFDLRLADIRVPVLIVGHEADGCLRTPAAKMSDIAARVTSVRTQTVTVVIGPGRVAYVGSGLEACEGRTAHGFLDQETEVISGIARFVRGGSY